MSRISNSLKNISTQLLSTVIIAVLGFVSRKVFVDNLGTEYLGLNGLLSNILGMLSLVEGGIGTSIVYNLYKPLADNDKPKIIALVQLYRKIYRVIALLVFLLSLILFPFLDIFIKGGEDLSHVSIVYFIFVANTIIGYFMADKWSLVNSDQKQYKLAGFNIAYQIGLYLLRILILIKFKNYILYLVVELICSIVYNLFIVKKVNQLYPFIKTKENYSVPSETRSNIITNVKALFLHSTGGYLVHSTDNIIISSFVNISAVGIYSNFRLLVIQFSSLSKSFFNGVKESVGNLVATEGIDKQFEVFKTLFFINFLITSFIVCLLYNTLNPFVSWWLGNDYLVSNSTIIAICLLFFVDEIRSSIMMYKVVSALFVPDRYVVFMTAIINIIVSILLVKKYQMTGVLLGSSISILLTASWNWPRIVYKYVFKRSPLHYYVLYVIYFIITVFTAFVSRLINDTIVFSYESYSISQVVARAMTVCVIFSLIIIILFWKSGPLKNIISMAKSYINSKKHD